MEQKHLNIFLVVLLVGIIGVSSVAVVQQMSYQSLDSEYQDLLTDYETLSSDWNQTSDDLNDLQSEFETMQTSYLTLIDDYASLSEIHLIVLSNNTNLQQSLDDLQVLYDQLLEDFALLNASFVELEQNHADLQADYAQLQSDYDELQVNYNQLLLDYNDLMAQYQVLQDSYNALVLAYDTLELQYDALVLDYDALLSDYNALANDFSALQNDYDALELAYNTLSTWIRQQILPVQHMVFAEAVRQYYLQDYLDQSSDTKGWYRQYTRFCRDLVLHASGQWDPFQTVSEAFSDALLYGSDTMSLTYWAMYSMAMYDGSSWQTFPYRWGWSFSPENWGIDIVVQDCIDNIDYEYDTDITYGQSGATWDYPKHPVETAFRTMGDCEDQAILTAAYLERTSFYNATDNYRFETAMAIFHDPAHPTLGSFYHATLLVHIEDTADFYSRYPLGVLWNLGGGIDPYSGFTWCWLDPTWNVPFGAVPSWLTAYRIHGGLGYDVMSIAINDYNGGIAQTGNGPLGAYVP